MLRFRKVFAYVKYRLGLAWPLKLSLDKFDLSRQLHLYDYIT